MNLSNTTTLITGGAGLVGSALAERLLSQDADVRVVDDLSKGERARSGRRGVYAGGYDRRGRRPRSDNW